MSILNLSVSNESQNLLWFSENHERSHDKTPDIHQQNYHDTSFDLNDRQLYRLPSTKDFEYDFKILKEPHTETNDRPISQQSGQILIRTKGYLKQMMQGWSDSDHFEFTLPSTVFYEEHPPVIYHPFIDELCKPQRKAVPLSAQQLMEIKYEGRFKVNCNDTPIPEIWEINQNFFTGVIPTREEFQLNISRAYQQLLEIPKRFFSNKQKHFYSHSKDAQALQSLMKQKFETQLKRMQEEPCILGIYPINAQQALKIILRFFPKIFNVLVGLSVVDGPTRNEKFSNLYHQYCDNIVQKQFAKIDFEKFLKEKPQTKFQIYDPNDKQSLIDNKAWMKKLSEMVDLLYENNPSSAQLKYKNETIENINQKRKDKLKFTISQIEQEIQKQLQDQRSIKDGLKHLIEILKAEEVIEWNTFLAEMQLDELRESIVEQLLANNPISSLIRPWFFEKVAQLIFLDKEKIYHQSYEKTKIQIADQMCIMKFEEAIRLKQDFQLLFDISCQKFISANLFPQRVYYIRKENYMSRTVIRDPVTQAYMIQSSTEYTVDTWRKFWRIRLFCIRLCVWTYNLATLFLHLSFRSQFGILALIYCIPYYSALNVDINGNIFRSDFQNPVCRKFGLVLQSISRQNEKFNQEHPADDCCFCCDKIASILLLLLVRFLVEGIFVTLVLLPIFILVFSFICFMIFLMSPFLVLFFLIIRQFVVIFFIDLDHPIKEQTANLNSHPSLKLVNPECLPLVFTIIQLMICGFFKLIFCVLFALVLHPLFAVLLFLYSLFQWLLTTIRDQFIFVLIICQGRQPGGDSCMAKQISGWGLGRRYFSTIETRDLKIFILGKLETIMLDEYENRMNELISKPIEEAQKMVRNFFSHFCGQSSEFAYIPPELIESCQKLKDNFSEAMKARRKQLTLMPMANVRFTEKELQINMTESQDMVEKLVASRKMSSYIWKYSQTKEKDFEQLNKILWIAVFGSKEVLEPIEEIQKRFYLKKQYDQNHIRSIIQVIEGETKMVLHNPGYAVLPDKIVKKKIPFNNISTIVDKCLSTTIEILDDPIRFSQIFSLNFICNEEHTQLDIKID